MELDHHAQALLAQNEDQVIRIMARKPRSETERTLDQADREVRYVHNLSPEARLYFLEVERGDASSFEETLKVTGEQIGKALYLAREESRGC